MKTKTIRLHVLAGLVAGGLTLSSLADAATFNWIGEEGGEFTDPDNWQGPEEGLVPTSGDLVIFANSLPEQTITLEEDVEIAEFRVNLTTGPITFDFGDSVLKTTSFGRVGTGAPDLGHLILASGELDIGNQLFLGTASTDNILEVAGPDSIMRVALRIRMGALAGANDNTLIIRDGGQLIAASDAHLGDQGDGNSSTVTGAGSLLSVALPIRIGAGNAKVDNELFVLDGGTVTSGGGLIGNGAGSDRNQVTVSGEGSHWTSTGGLFRVGGSGSASKLLIQDGGAVTVNAMDVTLGFGPASINNLVEVSGGGVFSVERGIDVRRGTLLIEEGIVEAAFLLANTDSGGTLTSIVEFNSGLLSLGDSSFDMASPLQVGDGGHEAAIYRMLNGGEHRFAQGVVLSGNGHLEGSGTIIGDVSGASGATVTIGTDSDYGQIDHSGLWDNTNLATHLKLGDISEGQFDTLVVNETFRLGGSIEIDVSELVAPDGGGEVRVIRLLGDVDGVEEDLEIVFVGGNPVQYRFEAPPSGFYAQWQSDFFTVEQLSDNSVSGPAAVPAGDGVPNIFKYALNLDPFEPSREGSPRVSIDGDFMAVSISRLAAAEDLKLSLEVSENLGDWTPVDAGINTEPDGDRVVVSLLDTVPVDAGTQRFARVKAQRAQGGLVLIFD